MVAAGSPSVRCTWQTSVLEEADPLPVPQHEAFEHVRPTCERPMADVEVLAKRVQRQRRADAFWQQVDQLLYQ